jgi:hypothetical protein
MQINKEQISEIIKMLYNTKHGHTDDDLPEIIKSQMVGVDTLTHGERKKIYVDREDKKLLEYHRLIIDIYFFDTYLMSSSSGLNDDNAAIYNKNLKDITSNPYYSSNYILLEIGPKLNDKDYWKVQLNKDIVNKPIYHSDGEITKGDDINIILRQGSDDIYEIFLDGKKVVDRDKKVYRGMIEFTKDDGIAFILSAPNGTKL